MIKITASSTTKRTETPIIKDENTTTPNDIIREAGFGDLRGTWLLNGSGLDDSKRGKTFAELGYGSATGRTQVMLTNVVKADNA